MNDEDSATTAFEKSWFGDGKDGNLVISPYESRFVNYYATADGRKGNNCVSLSNTKVFKVGREVCVIQMKGNNAGSNMFARVVGKDKNKLALNVGLTFNCSTTGSVDRCQVVTVPHFSTVTLKTEATLTGRRWDGNTGGVIIFRANEKV